MYEYVNEKWKTQSYILVVLFQLVCLTNSLPNENKVYQILCQMY